MRISFSLLLCNSGGGLCNTPCFWEFSVQLTTVYACYDQYEHHNVQAAVSYTLSLSLRPADLTMSAHV